MPPVSCYTYKYLFFLCVIQSPRHQTIGRYFFVLSLTADIFLSAFVLLPSFESWSTVCVGLFKKMEIYGQSQGEKTCKRCYFFVVYVN